MALSLFLFVFILHFHNEGNMNEVELYQCLETVYQSVCLSVQCLDSVTSREVASYELSNELVHAQG